MNTIYLGLGSNLGNREKNISLAIDEIKNIGVNIDKCSSTIETDPVGGPSQEKYLNAVIKGETEMSPQILLQELKNIEIKLGRVKTIINGPREIDIDILLYANLKIDTENLTIPHPRMFGRKFVMDPLGEIEPQFVKDLINENY